MADGRPAHHRRGQLDRPRESLKTCRVRVRVQLCTDDSCGKCETQTSRRTGCKTCKLQMAAGGRRPAPNFQSPGDGQRSRHSRRPGASDLCAARAEIARQNSRQLARCTNVNTNDQLTFASNRPGVFFASSLSLKLGRFQLLNYRLEVHEAAATAATAAASDEEADEEEEEEEEADKVQEVELSRRPEND